MRQKSISILSGILPVLAAQILFSTVVNVRALPIITTQLTNQIVLAGSNATFVVAVSGTGPFSYQWQFNGTNLPNSVITTVAGNGTGTFSGDNSQATNASLANPSGVALDANGNYFIADYSNNRIRKVATNGVITTVAGNGTPAYSGDNGAATSASLNGPRGVAVDSVGNLFIADYWNHCIRKVGTNGVITTVAGNGSGGFSGDSGAATNATLNFPTGVAVDFIGNLFIADSLNYRIRKVGTNGVITTVAGNGSGGFAGDNGTATAANLYAAGVTVDGSGNILIADNGNNRIRKVGTNGIITTVAGNGFATFFGDGGVATSASLTGPAGVAVDAIGNLFIADYGNYRIRRVGTNGIISTEVGNGAGTYSGDGGASTNASLNLPRSVIVDSIGNLLIADNNNNRVRKVTYAGPVLTLNSVTTNNSGNYQVIITDASGSVTSSVIAVLTVVIPPSITSQPTNLTLYAGATAVFNATAIGTTNLSYRWFFNNAVLPGQVNPTLILNNVQTNNNGNYKLVVTNNYGSATSSVASLTVIVTPTFSSVTRNPNGSLTYNFAVTPGTTNRMWAATNLTPPIVWQVIATNVAGLSTTWQITDTNVSQNPTRFFRGSTP